MISEAKSYNELARNLEKTLNEASTEIGFSVDDFDTMQMRSCVSDEEAQAASEYSGQPITAQEVRAIVSNMFMIHWASKISEKRAVGSYLIDCQLVEDPYVDVADMVISAIKQELPFYE